jgi:hypothetical protein
VECWGINHLGQAPPVKTAISGGFTQVSAGDQHACAVRTDGAVECWGSNWFGQAPPLVTDTVLPVATFTADSAVDEGSTFTLSLTSAQVPGYDGSPFRYFLDCGVFPFTIEAGSRTCSAAEGPANRMVIGVVRDRDGDQAIFVDTVRINNVAPTVGAMAGAQILVTETYSTSGSFADPGTFDTHTAAADYGDGSVAMAVPVTGATFNLSHRYMVSGVFTATVDVTDDDGDVGSQSATVTVVSIEEYTGGLKAQISALVDAGSLSVKEGRSLNSKLDRMLTEQAGGRKISARRFLDLFRAQVIDLINDGTLTPAQGDPLVAGADRLAPAIAAS